MQLDMSKAFDKISWEYIKGVLANLGFNKYCIKWMAMATGAFFSILLNDSPSQTFSPSKGIRQGDPISPFLFSIMVEGLSRSITADSSREDLSRLKLYKSPPPLNSSEIRRRHPLNGYSYSQRRLILQRKSSWVLWSLWYLHKGGEI